MDFGQILTRAWQITWRWKILWLLGFLASLGSGLSSVGNSSYRFSSEQMADIITPNMDFVRGLAGLAVGLACLAFVVGIILWVVSIIARGGLIAGVLQVEESGATSFGSAWRVGQTRFWTLFGIGVLVALPVIVLVIAAVASLVAVLVPWFTVTGTEGSTAAPNTLGVIGIICATCLICVTILLGLVLAQIQLYAERAAILEGLNWTGSFARGWEVLRRNLGPTIILWLIFLVLGVVFAAITAVLLLPLFLPVVGLVSQDAQPNAWWVLLCGGGLVAVVVGAVVNSIVQVFSSATWTLAYRALTAGPGTPAAVLVPPVLPLAPDTPVTPAPEPTPAEDI